MRASEQQWGIVAILDALGAASYSDVEIARFVRSREVVLALLTEKAEATLGDIKKVNLTTFTFADTVVIVYKTQPQTTVKDLRAFLTLLRKLLVDSLVNSILFRGALAIGSFYANDDTNTVLGEAVADAAAWYEAADWIGVHATPRASLYIESLIASSGLNLDRLVLDYPVPFRDNKTQVLKAINWPRAFFVSGITPCSGGEDERAKCLALLSVHRVPKGTEGKYFNALAFFDHACAVSPAEPTPDGRATKRKK